MLHDSMTLNTTYNLSKHFYFCEQNTDNSPLYMHQQMHRYILQINSQQHTVIRMLCTCTIGFSVVVFIWLFFSISLEHLYFCVFKSTSPNDVCVCVVLCGKKWNKFKLNYRFICWSSIIFVLWPPLTWPSSRVAVLHSEFIPKGAVAYNRYTLTSSKHSTRPL